MEQWVPCRRPSAGLALLSGIDAPPFAHFGTRRRPAHGDAARARERLAAAELAPDHHRHLDKGPAIGFDRLAGRADIRAVGFIGLEIVGEAAPRLVAGLA